MKIRLHPIQISVDFQVQRYGNMFKMNILSKIISCIVVVLFIIMCLWQSNKKSETDRVDTEKVSTEQHLDTQVTNESWQCADLNDKFENNSNDITVSAKDIYDALGYGWVECQKTGYYRFEATGNVYDINSPHPKESLIWQVYILDEPFTDIPNGIPSVKKHIKLEEQQYIEKGQYIVFYCSQNVKSYGAETVGDDSAFLECHFLDEN